MFGLLIFVSIVSMAAGALETPRPVNIRFAGSGGGGGGFGYLEVGMSNGEWGPVCDLNGGFDLHAVQLACVLLGYNATLAVSKLSASSLSESQAQASAPVVGISNCDAFKLNIPSTWQLSIACTYVAGKDIPVGCYRRQNHVQISCHGNLLPTQGGGSVPPAALTIATEPPPPPPRRLPRGHCGSVGVSAAGRTVELRGRTPVLAGQTICSVGFAYREAEAVCAVLCNGPFVGLPVKLTSNGVATASASLLSCGGLNSIDNCTATPATSCTAKGGPAGLDCISQGGPREPRPSLDCSDRSFRVAFELGDVGSPDRLALGPAHRPGECSEAVRGQNVTHVWMEMPYTKCNVTQSYNATHQLYSMQLLLLPADGLLGPGVHTQPLRRLPLLCALPSRHSLGAQALEVAAPPLAEARGDATFRVDIGLFARLGAAPDGSGLEFYEPLLGGRLAVQLGQRLYARVRLLGVEDSLAVRLRLLACWVTGRPAPDSLPRLDLLLGRCPVESASVRLIEASDRVVGLGFPAFRFADVGEEGLVNGGRLHVHCNVSVCNRSDPGCRGCDSLRRRRRRHVAVGMAGDAAVSTVHAFADVYGQGRSGAGVDAVSSPLLMLLLPVAFAVSATVLTTLAGY